MLRRTQRRSNALLLTLVPKDPAALADASPVQPVAGYVEPTPAAPSQALCSKCSKRCVSGNAVDVKAECEGDRWST